MLFPFYFVGTKPNGDTAIATFVREVAIVDGLDAHMLLGIDIMKPEDFDICLSSGYTIIHTCGGMRIPMSAWKTGHQKPVFCPPLEWLYTSCHHCGILVITDIF